MAPLHLIGVVKHGVELSLGVSSTLHAINLHGDVFFAHVRPGLVVHGLGVQEFQVALGELVHDACTECVAQHVYGCTEPVTAST